MDLPSGLEGVFRARRADTDKYAVGTVAIIGGSANYISAPVIAALGSRAGGAGLIKLVGVAPESRICASFHVPEATFAELDSDSSLPRADVYAVGMGLGMGEKSAAIVAGILKKECGRFLLDADALTILANLAGARGGMKCGAAFCKAFGGDEAKEIILTPHEGEAARLLGVDRAAVAADRLGSAKKIAEIYGAICVLKGPKTLVTTKEGRVYENTSGNSAMSLGGMGDLLSGVIAARWAYLKDAFASSAGGVWLHGAASDELLAGGGDPSIVETAKHIGALRARLEKI